MRWLDGISDVMDMRFSRLRDAVPGVANRLSDWTEQSKNKRQKKADDTQDRGAKGNIWEEGYLVQVSRYSYVSFELKYANQFSL